MHIMETAAEKSKCAIGKCGYVAKNARESDTISQENAKKSNWPQSGNKLLFLLREIY